MDDIIKAYAVKNNCYKAAQKMVPAGIVVHSTGVNNPHLKRYVDCPEEVGTNSYGNHWNTAKPGGSEVCVHAFIGYDKNNKVRVAEILPLNICCWGVGNGTKGSYNYNPPYIQFEICEDALTDKVFYAEAFCVAAEYCAHLCTTYKLSVNQIVSHKEAHDKGYGSNHNDPEHWMKRFGENMDDFRKQVASLLSSGQSAKAQSPVSSAIHEDDLVSIVKGAVYYSGKAIPDWVQKQNWYVAAEPTGSRVVINQNEQKINAINSPVDAKYLKVVRSATTHFKAYPVKITTSSLNIRKGPGTNYVRVGSITDHGVYTIVDEQSGTGASKWGKLKSGAGWIALDYTKNV